jgi:hypothetical protein
VTSTFEIHAHRIFPDAHDRGVAIPLLDSADGGVERSVPVLLVPQADGLIWMKFDDDTGRMARVEAKADARVGLKVVTRRLTAELAIVKCGKEIRVNSLPAGLVQMVGTRDSITMAPGWLCYVTERVKPHVGLALKEHIGVKCPFCRIPIDANTHVVTCRCGAIYHHETEESHPASAEADRLRCIEKIRTCLVCGREVSTKEHLVWDPEGA